jgi:16S rRNA (cytosine967-C5)-methyltransferase
VQRATPREISSGRKGRAYQQPFRKPGGKPFAKGDSRRPSGGPGPAPAGDEPPSPHAGKFYERFVKRPKRRPDDARDERGGPPRSRWLQSSERVERIPSSARARDLGGRDDRPAPRPDYRRGPAREDYRRRDDEFRGDRVPSSERRERSGASGGYRREFEAGPRRDEFARRDDRREYPRDDRRERPFQRPWNDDERRAPRDDRRGGGFFRKPVRPAPHLQKRIVRSEGAKADQRPLPPEPTPAAEAPVSRAREVAARVLLRRLHASAFIEDLLDDAFAAVKMRPDDRRLAQELAYGCVRWQGTLDWLVARRTDDRPQLATVQIFLRLGLYQLFFLDRIPPHAACYETVELSKQLGCGNQSNFINAILRRSEAERDTIEVELAELRETVPHLGYSHPEWLVRKWTARWGADDTRRLLEWNNAAPATHVRVNLLKTTPAALIERWRLRENVEYELAPCPWADDGHVLTLKTHPPLPALGSFRDGWFYVQDPSTLLAAQAVEAWAGESILDLCAAPGGKTCHLAQKMENDGALLACDTEAGRLKLVTENCARLGVTCVKTLALGDHPDQALFGKQFDKALVDAPCSNTGVLRRRLDLRWRLRPEEIKRLRATQLKLLALAAKHLKPGGLLVYSTCSLEPEENSDVVKEFLAAHPAFKLESERELLPFRDGVDGAYVAKLRLAS